MPEFLAQNEGWDIFVEPEIVKIILILLKLHLLQWANTFTGHALEFWRVHHYHWMLSCQERQCRRL